MKLYGIPNCNTVKKARTWLTENHIDTSFHDFKKQGVSEELLKTWLKQISWEKLVNRQGTTWRQLPDEAKAAVCDDASAIRLMLEKSSVIKRPVLEMDGKITLGFDEATYQTLFRKK
ncbi:MAG: ArsC family reductase [Gammaproteobacteria bacterium]|nr:ArsC family reductase [Gammaproteobacteria bacterium]